MDFRYQKAQSIYDLSRIVATLKKVKDTWKPYQSNFVGQKKISTLHIDGSFCHATIRSMESVAFVLGPDQFVFLSIDDKSRVGIGISAAKKQAPM